MSWKPFPDTLRMRTFICTTRSQFFTSAFSAEKQAWVALKLTSRLPKVLCEAPGKAQVLQETQQLPTVWHLQAHPGQSLPQFPGICRTLSCILDAGADVCLGDLLEAQAVPSHCELAATTTPVVAGLTSIPRERGVSPPSLSSPEFQSSVAKP